MPFKLFYSILEKRFKRVSLTGLIKDYPTAYDAIKRGYLEAEAYEMLSSLETERDELDDTLIIFIREQGESILPLVFLRQDHYTPNEYEALCSIVEDLTLEKCHEMIAATN